VAPSATKLGCGLLPDAALPISPLGFDDEGKQLDDNQAAHLHARRIIEKIYRLVPDAERPELSRRFPSRCGRRTAMGWSTPA